MALLKLYCLSEHCVQRTKGGVSTVSYHCYSLKMTEFTTPTSQMLQKKMYHGFGRRNLGLSKELVGRILQVAVMKRKVIK